MAEIVTLELSEALAQQARQIASLTHRRLEDVLLEWIDRAVTELPIESLPDEQILTLCDLHMEPEQQERLSDLLAQNQEGQISPTELDHLDQLMKIYRRGLVHKARALKVAVEKGLKPPLAS
ncbi:MAG: hypothetical protein KME11_15840 [Timaviella obliquedivisa GSE-PSE-MK23-08B]|jgi:hypothetical protein|nr:hypothetical protein [Timaviella obliquedivisa GSE-PSE-MK23-08B]